MYKSLFIQQANNSSDAKPEIKPIEKVCFYINEICEFVSRAKNNKYCQYIITMCFYKEIK